MHDGLLTLGAFLTITILTHIILIDVLNEYEHVIIKHGALEVG